MGSRSMRTLFELAVFVPIGLAAELRERVEGRIALARVVGEMAVKAGVEQVRARAVDAMPEPVVPPLEPTITPAGVVEVADVAATSITEQVRGVETDAAPNDPETLPIVDYESLAASQVVARLPALSNSELDQVASFEQSNRRRRTVLGKIDQLQRA